VDLVSIPTLTVSDSEDSAAEINRLHATIIDNCGQCETKLHEALLAAWRAGQLLRERKIAIRRSMGPGAWINWLGRHFKGSIRTAQRYMALAKNVTDVSHLSGLSLRQTYMRLGLSVEKRGTHDPVAIQALPNHLRVTNRFLAAVPTPKAILRLSNEERMRWQRDLSPAWDRLRLLFEPARDSGQRLTLAG
jgi:hypothetical protein